MNARERRQEIIDILIERGYTKYSELMNYFGVSYTTIYRDICELSISYPLYTIAQKKGGGVYLSENFKLGKKFLTDEEANVLESLKAKTSDTEQKILEEIIKKFSIKRRSI